MKKLSERYDLLNITVIHCINEINMKLYRIFSLCCFVGVFFSACENKCDEQDPCLDNKIICTLPDNFIVVQHINAIIYFNEIIKGVDNETDNTLKDIKVVISADNEDFIGKEVIIEPEGIKILFDEKFVRSHKFNLQVYNPKNKLLYSKDFYIKVVDNKKSVNAKTILMLGDSWTSINDLITGEGYVYYLNQFFKEIVGSQLNFIGSRFINGPDKIAHEGRGGYTFQLWTSRPSGDLLNPLWNPSTNKIDFTNYREKICKWNTNIDLVSIQLGVNESLRKEVNPEEKNNMIVKKCVELIDCILEDSPACKIVINQAGLDKVDPEAFSTYPDEGLKKEIYQESIYNLRVILYEQLASDSRFGKNIFGDNRFWG
ncbi:MAG: hypothetical protein LUD02_04055 [Tannerellaceae bacterium]|nr:hypothetical protein [Tannerellaceae bacterium]